MEKPVILCVDDEKTVLNSLRQELEHSLGDEYLFELAESAEEGLEIVEELAEYGQELHVVISDQLMPGMKGDDFLIRIHKQLPKVKKILLTGQADAAAVGRAINEADLYRYIAKPWDEADLAEVIRNATKSFKRGSLLGEEVRLLQALNHWSSKLATASTPEAVLTVFAQAFLEEAGCSRVVFRSVQPESNLPGRTYLASAEHPSLQEYPREQQKEEGFPLQHLLALEDQPLILSNATYLNQWNKLPYIKDRSLKALYARTVHLQGTEVYCWLESTNAGQFTAQLQGYLEQLFKVFAIVAGNATLTAGLEQKVEQQSVFMERSHKDLANDLKFAKEIQQAILPTLGDLEQRFKGFAVGYKPKDEVSGDFYWHGMAGENLLFVAADCTGHGVPGAFMSVLGTNLLDHIIHEEGIHEPVRILEELHKGVRSALKQYDETSEVQDGMELGLLSFSPDLREAKYAGARRPLWLIRKGELLEFRAARYPIGGSNTGLDAPEKGFQQSIIHLKPGDKLVLHSDGIADQLGGPNLKKFSNKALQATLLERPKARAKGMVEAVMKAVEDWQAQAKQTQMDDWLLAVIQPF